MFCRLRLLSRVFRIQSRLALQRSTAGSTSCLPFLVFRSSGGTFPCRAFSVWDRGLQEGNASLTRAEQPELGGRSIEPLLRDGRYNGRPWSAAEDMQLRLAVERYGKDWVKVAAVVGNGRTNRGCRQRWTHSVRDAVVRRRLTRREIRTLMELSEAYPKQWKKIAEELGSGHTSTQIREVVVNRLDRSIAVHRWTDEEDALLREAVRRHGLGKWSLVAAMVPGRSDKRCLERWTFSLAPGLVRGAWTPEEDKRLMAAVKDLKRLNKPFHFGHVADLMRNTRHRKGCRQRYHRLLKKQRAAGT